MKQNQTPKKLGELLTKQQKSKENNKTTELKKQDGFIKASRNDTCIYIFKNDFISDKKLDNDILKKNIEKLKLSFPSIKLEWFKVLADRVIDNNFSNERLTKAINYCIDNFNKGMHPHIADIIQYDVKIKIYNYAQMCNDEKLNWQDMVKIDVGLNKPRWILKTDYFKNKSRVKLWRVKK